MTDQAEHDDWPECQSPEPPTSCRACGEPFTDARPFIYAFGSMPLCPECERLWMHLEHNRDAVHWEAGWPANMILTALDLNEAARRRAAGLFVAVGWCDPHDDPEETLRVLLADGAKPPRPEKYNVRHEWTQIHDGQTCARRWIRRCGRPSRGGWPVPRRSTVTRRERWRRCWPRSGRCGRWVTRRPPRASPRASGSCSGLFAPDRRELPGGQAAARAHSISECRAGTEIAFLALGPQIRQLETAAQRTRHDVADRPGGGPAAPAAAPVGGEHLLADPPPAGRRLPRAHVLIVAAHRVFVTAVSETIDVSTTAGGPAFASAGLPQWMRGET